ncbi:microprocessor complex subunit DGCR8-like [Agrilus planipennis]|uniref:Microprocessor complex subunit DGCR8-like n=1 Tax=Agrilus planipennis TaxID=224129 RepID=A0A7F5R9X3_AGRPL|nr:microprocessor complex subunit DGCR8-like [Agrilus planipennis]
MEATTDQIAVDNIETNSTAECPFNNGLRDDTNEEVSDERKFHVLDETNESDSPEYDSDSDVPDEEVEKMLEEALNNKKRTATEAELDKDKSFEEKDKPVLIERGQNHFEILPEGWIHVIHNSGMPIYLHKTTRVCTLSKPYFLGPGSARVSWI